MFSDLFNRATDYIKIIPRQWVRCWVGLYEPVQAWASGDFLEALSSRPETERKAIMDYFFQRMEVQFRAEPTLHKEDSPTAYIIMKKIIE